MKIQYRGYTIEIEQDSDAQSPSEWGDDGLFLVANHRDFYVPLPSDKRITETANEIVERFKKTHWIFPIEAYIHSGVRIALAHCGNFPDRQWDVSQVGFIFAAKEEWRMKKSALKSATALMNEWNTYLSGDVWCYSVENENESCCGFYGHEYCIEQAKEAVDYIITQKLKSKLEKLKSYIVNHVPLKNRTFAL